MLRWSSINDAFSLLRKLISYDTVSPEGKQYEEFAKFVKGWFEERGIEAKIEYVDKDYRSKVCPTGSERPIIIAKVGDGDPLLEFNGHYDVVPPGEGWESDPFDAKLVNGYVIGRGAVDMKGGVAAIMLAMANLSNWKGSEIKAVLVPDEEVGGLCGTAYRVNALKDKYPVGKKVVIAEPSSRTVWIGHKGVIWLEVEVSGVQAHASMPWVGENAFIKAASLAIEIDRALKEEFSKTFSKYEYTSGHPMAKFTVYNIGGVAYSTSNKENVIPGSFKFSIDVRTVPEVRPEDVVRKIEEIVEGRGKVRVKFVDQGILNENSELAELIEKTWGEPKRVCEAGLDMRFYRGYDVVTWGPGDSMEAHKPNEKIRLTEVEEFAKRYAKLPYLL
ncbi:acetylornithine deacetylase [Ignicoccus islandicus DSM 13165]|uniref:Acetylornithine deacetylase n=1 Tax=Ignicoccus islandicus DSM 13165 TaxID=940295 RepID=A0A0U3F705_9CREN|nr:M20 family metallopeptidase [Ignicoccus islandicus]ALU11417.1 acetylornithine deacetylase [Ignicoccus islandicus DSM 13165]